MSKQTALILSGGAAQAAPFPENTTPIDTRIWCVRWPTDWDNGEIRMEVFARDKTTEYGRIFIRDHAGNVVEIDRHILWDLLYTYGKDLISLIHADAESFRKAQAAKAGADG
jgi:hypothetical protein